MIKFSIITVCLNAGQDLIDTVENTLNQSYDNFEIIVKDGFSKDGCGKLLQKSKLIKVLCCIESFTFSKYRIKTRDFLV